MKRRRQKGTGTLVVRGRTFYARWTVNGVTTTESTGIRQGDTKKVLEAGVERTVSARELAEEYLLERTEPMRLRRRESRLAMLHEQLKGVRQLIEDAEAKFRRRVRLGEMEGLFLASPRRPACGEKQMRNYRQIIRSFADSAGADVCVADVTDDMVSRYVTALGRRVRNTTYNKTLNALQMTWRVLEKETGVQDNPWESLTRLKNDSHTRRILAENEVREILKDRDDGFAEVRVLVAVGLYTGLRLGDACHVRWEDVGKDEIRVKTAKTGATVAIPIHPRFRDLLAGRKGRRTGFVIPSVARAYDEDSTSVTKMVTKVFKAAGIATAFEVKGKRSVPDCSFHSLRHTFVTRAIEAGVPTAIVQAIVGHSTALMTEHYTHVRDEAILKAFSSVS